MPRGLPKARHPVRTLLPSIAFSEPLRERWESQSACGDRSALAARGFPATAYRWWFAPKHTIEHEQAKALCRRCPFQLTRCLARAQRFRPWFGIWAGLHAEDLRVTEYDPGAVLVAIANQEVQRRNQKPWNRVYQHWDPNDEQ